MAVYDEEKPKTLPSDDELRRLTGISEDEEGAMDREAHNAAAEDIAGREGLKQPLSDENLDNKDKGKKSLTTDQLGAAEAGTAVGGAGAVANDTVGAGYTGDSKKSASGALNNVREFVNKNRRGLVVGGGVGGGLIALIIFGFAAVVPFELIHIAKNLLNDEAKIEQRVEKKAAQKLMQRMICAQLQVGCKDIPEDNADKPSASEEATAETEGEQLTEEMDKFDLTNPDIVQALAKQGITVETDPNTGQLTGLKDASGNDVTEEVGTNDALFDSIESALPESSAGQLELYRPLMVDEAGVSFSGLPDTANDNVDQTISDEVTKGATATDIADAAGEVTEENNGAPNNSSPTVQGEFNNASEATGKLGDAINATEQALANGESDADATTAGVNAFGSFGDPIFLSSIATTACTLEKAVNTAAKDRVPTIMMLLMRHGNLLLSVADQIKTGHITSNEVGSTTQLLNGDPSAKPNSDGTPSEASMPFSQSATWQRATGNPVSSLTPDILSSALPTENGGTKIVNDIDGNMKTLKLNLACGALTSWAGSLLQVGLGIGQLATDIGSFGTTQIAITATVLTVQTTLQKVVLPEIIQYFTPVGLNGKEDSVQWLNNAGAGLNLSSGNYGRRIGMAPLTQDQATTLADAADQDTLIAEKNEPFTERMFALSNPDSLVSHVADDMPLSLGQSMASLTGLISTMPSTLFHTLASIITPSRVLADTTNSDPDPGQSAGITQYGLSDTQLDQYDPKANEAYLFSNVTAGGKSIRRIDALGNPNTYTDSPSGDSNNDDLLHCFVDPFAMIEEADPNSGADTHCHNIGMYDYANSSPTDLPTDNDVVAIYCDALGNPSGCAATVTPQVNNDVGRFESYLLYDHVMSDYTTLTTDQ